MPSTPPDDDAGQSAPADLLYGVPAIAAFLGFREHQARHVIAEGRIPTFRMGSIICSRRSTLNAWLDEQTPTVTPSDV